MSLGVRAGIADTLLIAKARSALAAGPLDASALVSAVLSLPGAPVRVAARLAESLLSPHAEFQRSPDGIWSWSRQPVRRPSGDLRLTAIDYAVVDVETTGGSSQLGGRVVEIAVVAVDGGVVGETYARLVNPGCAIPWSITKLTGITTELVRHAPAFEEIAVEVSGRLHNRVFVAHNATFDWRFVGAELQRVGKGLAGDKLCTVRLVRTLLPHLPRRGLDAVAQHFGIQIRQRHRAGGDAEATARVLTHLLGVAADQGLDTWPLLMDRLDRRTGRKKRGRRGMPSPVDVDATPA